MASARPVKKIEYLGKTLSGQLLIFLHQEFKKYNIIKLRLKDCRISAEEFRKLIPILEQHRHWLEELDLSGTHIGNQGAILISILSQKSPLLHTLNLANNKICSDCVDHFERMLQIRENPLNLNLNGNPLIEFLKRTLSTFHEYPLLYSALKLNRAKLSEIKDLMTAPNPATELNFDDSEVEFITKTVVANAIQKTLELNNQIHHADQKDEISVTESKKTEPESVDPDLDSYVHEISFFKSLTIDTTNTDEFEEDYFLSPPLSPLTPVN